MIKIVAVLCVFALFAFADADEPIKLGEKCSGPAAVCEKGSSCRSGACNCDNLEDGTIMSYHIDDKGTADCRHVTGQKCTGNDDCFTEVPCTNGVCTCPNDRACALERVDLVLPN